MREHTIEEWVAEYAPRTIGQESALPEPLRALFSLTDNGEALLALADSQNDTEKAEARSGKLSELIRDIVTNLPKPQPRRDSRKSLRGDYGGYQRRGGGDLMDRTIIETYLREINEAHEARNWLRMKMFAEGLAKFLERQNR